MPTLSLGQGLNKITASGGGPLDFSALTNLPESRQSAVRTAANVAASTLGVSPQSIIDALAAGRGLYSGLPEDGCNLVSSGGAATSQGDPIGAIQSWTGVELATQNNASLQPVSGADGLVADGTKVMNLVGLVVGDLEQLFVINTATAGALLLIGTSVGCWHPFSDNSFYDDCGTSNRTRSSINPNFFNKGIYSASQSGGSYTMRWNNSVIGSGSGTQTLTIPPALLRSKHDSRYNGTISAGLVQNTLLTLSQRNAVMEFCRSYFGVTY